MKSAAFILIKTELNAHKVLGSIKESHLVKWASNIYGPYQIIAYVEDDENDRPEVIEKYLEDLRSRRFITELDARVVKGVPGDEKLKSFSVDGEVSAALLINVNYKEEKERYVTYNLREIEGVAWARAMWGPNDIIAIVTGADHEELRNLICDDIKTLKGVQTNTTLYCYANEPLRAAA